MASTIKYTADEILNHIRHDYRTIKNPKNNDIDISKSKYNYSFPMEHPPTESYEYYQNIIGNSYIYGRGTQREKEAVTAFEWVVTLPSELLGFPDKEKEFFKETYVFITKRYGMENIIANAVHYDEAGLPHLQVMVAARTELNHELVQNKTIKTKKAIQTETGRYEFEQKLKLDSEGNKIKINNYARVSDYYDFKIDANSILNPIELKHFHKDLQDYLISKNVEGKVITGSTGANFSVKELKEFSNKTGLRLEEVKELIQGNILENLVNMDQKIHSLEEIIKSKDLIIDELKNEVKLIKVHGVDIEKEKQIVKNRSCEIIFES